MLFVHTLNLETPYSQNQWLVSGVDDTLLARLSPGPVQCRDLRRGDSSSEQLKRDHGHGK